MKIKNLQKTFIFLILELNLIEVDRKNMLISNKIKKFVSSKKILSKIEFEKKISEGFRYEVSKNKLKHDIEQISYLLKKKLVSKKFNNIVFRFKIFK